MSLISELEAVPAWAWALLLGAGLVGLTSTGSRRYRRPVVRMRGDRPVLRGAWRFATGAHMDGVVRTDAGWWTSGTRDLTGGQRLTQWSYRPRGIRAAIRWAVVATVAAWVAAWVAWGAVVVYVTSGIAVAGISLMALRRARRAQHYRELVLPLHDVLAPVLGIPASTPPDSYLLVPRNWGAHRDAAIRVRLPSSFDGSAQDRMVRLVAMKMDVDQREVESAWALSGPTPTASFRRKPQEDQRPVYMHAWKWKRGRRKVG
jgi:hypothetical protein